MTSESIANGKHYKGAVITPDDVGQLMNADFLARKLGLCEKQKAVIVELLRSPFSSPCTSYLVGSAVDPFFVELHIKSLGLANGTIYKKVVRMGLGDKTAQQDRADIIGACLRCIELRPHIAKKYESIIKLIEKW